MSSYAHRDGVGFGAEGNVLLWDWYICLEYISLYRHYIACNLNLSGGQ